MTEAYAEPLAQVHDSGFAQHAEAAAEYLLSQLRAADICNGLVVALGCGSGILPNRLCQAGYDVLGIDISPAMIELARQRAPQATFHVQSLYEAQLPNCVAITAVGEILNYQFDPVRRDTQALTGLFDRAYQALTAPGLFIFDVTHSGRLGGATERQSFFEHDQWTVLVDSHEDAARRLLTRRCVVFRQSADGDLYERSEETHYLHLLEPEWIESALHKAGFAYTSASNYVSYDLPTGMQAFTARKCVAS